MFRRQRPDNCRNAIRLTRKREASPSRRGYKQHAPLTAEDIRGLTVAEARKLWLQRREPAKGGAGRPSIEITREAIEAEMKRRRQAGEPTSHKVLGRHFKCSPQTIARRLNEPPREEQG
jgi:hypothetical protein